MQLTVKQYQRIKLGLVFVLALIFSQSLVLKNFFIPVVVLIISSLLLMYLRKQVKGIIADERDYATAGRAAILAIQIYSWIVVVSMFILYALSDLNPYYYSVAMTLAFSTCILMLLYSLIFKFYNKIKFSDKKTIFLVVTVTSVLILGVFTVRFFSGEDNWICQNGEWVKYGQPDFPAPTTQCR
ncbi:MAG TPA: DUF2178 domain-containing protein [Candidatus Magasanikbacteria bacterium]|nr:DUF2178 domain-containing protein [Candidatus Magasanikbacteria bacterium]